MYKRKASMQLDGLGNYSAHDDITKDDGSFTTIGTGVCCHCIQ
jgi:hypothetical protein